MDRIRDALPTGALVAIVCAVLGFVFSFSFSSSTTVNGVVSCSSFDIAKLVLGAAAVIAGLRSLVTGRAEDKLQAGIIVAAITVPVGLLHVLTGLGVLFVECP